MATKKLMMLAATIFVLVCIPVVAGAALFTPPSYNQVYAGDTKITGMSSIPLSLTVKFPNGNTASTNAAGGGQTWTIPVSGTLKTGDVLYLYFTQGNNAPGYRSIIVASPGANLDGSTATSSGGTNSGGASTGGAVTSDAATTTAGATSTTSAASTTDGLPATGNARPLFTFAGGLLIVSLVLVLLVRATAFHRHQE